MSFVATGGNRTGQLRGSPLAVGRRGRRPALMAFALRCGVVALVLGAVGGLVAYAVPQFVAGPSARGAVVERAAPPASAIASHCWTNHTSATVFLGSWFAPLAPTQGLRSDCSVRPDPAPAGAVGEASRAYRGSSPSTPVTAPVAASSPSRSEPRAPQPAVAERVGDSGKQAEASGPAPAVPAGAGHAPRELPDAVSGTDDSAPGAGPKAPKPKERHQDGTTRDRDQSSPSDGHAVEPGAGLISRLRDAIRNWIDGLSGSGTPAIDQGGTAPHG